MTAAVATRPQVAALCKPTVHRGISATLVQGIGDPFGLAELRGRHLLQTHSTLCWGEVEAGDVIQVDFGLRAPGDGLCLLHIDDGDGRQWFGARRFCLMPSGMKIRDEHGTPEWVPVTPAMLARMTVYGRVIEVFKTRSRWEGSR